MPTLNIKGVKIQGLAACVPERVEENRDYSLIPQEQIEKYIETTGIERRHCAIHDGSICTSDLCLKAAEKLISDLGWDKNDIDLLVFVSQTCDYRLPATACILQERLGLKKSCLAFDVNQGCPGYMVGLGIAGNLMSSGSFNKGLLMVGNTQSEFANYYDRSMYLLLGDAGTVTALEYSPEKYDDISLSYMTDGSSYEHLIVYDGGSRNPLNEESFELKEYEDGNKRTRLNEKMDGADVFATAIKYVPKYFKNLMEYKKVDVASLDYVLIHQASKFLCEKLRKKVGATSEQVPYNIKDYGNTSGATLPLLMVTNLGDSLECRQLQLGFMAVGVGMALGVGYIQTKGNIHCSELQYL